MALKDYEPMPKAKKFPEILRPYENKWIALSLDNSRVIASDRSIDNLLKKLGDKKIRDVELMRVPDFAMGLAPIHSHR